MSKQEVFRWETVAGYVATFPSDEGEGACDVEVQVGSDPDGSWYVRTRDDAGGSDDADDTAYTSRDKAAAAAEEFAAAADESDGDSAETYLTLQLERRAGQPDPEGLWCVYWNSVGPDSGSRERYKTQDAATAATELANAELKARHPGNLLCSYEVRELVNGLWVGSEGV